MIEYKKAMDKLATIRVSVLAQSGLEIEFADGQVFHLIQGDRAEIKTPTGNIWYITEEPNYFIYHTFSQKVRDIFLILFKGKLYKQRHLT